MQERWPISEERGDNQRRDADVDHPQQPKQNGRAALLA